MCECYICGTEGMNDFNDDDSVICSVCGRYFYELGTPRLLWRARRTADNRIYMISGMTRKATERGVKPLVITSELVERVTSGTEREPDPMDKANHLLEYLAVRSKNKFGHVETVSFETDYPACSAQDNEEMKAILQGLVDDGLVDWVGEPTITVLTMGDGTHHSDGTDPPQENEKRSDGRASLTSEGWRRIGVLQAGGVGSNQAFVAMWADDTMEPIYRKAMVPALAATGWEDDCVNWRKRTEDLDEAILKGIEKCGLIVADVTGNRPCVYYEAGYAHALGKPVIFTVQKDFWDVRENRQFDTGKWRHVIWTDIAHLRTELVRCIDESGLVRGPTATPQADAGSSASAQLAP